MKSCMICADTQAPGCAPAPLTLRQAEIDIVRRLIDRKPHAEHKLPLLRHLCNDNNHDTWTYIQALNGLVERGAITYERGWYRANDKTAAIVEGDGK